MTASREPLVLAEPDVPFWGFGEIFLTIAVFLTALGLAAGIAAHYLHDDAKLGYWAVAQEFTAYAVLFTALKLLFHLQHKPLLASLGWVSQRFRPGTLLGVGFGLFLISVSLQILLQTPELQTPFDKLINSDPRSRIAIAIFGVTVAPVVEELLFRGLLQPVLMNAAGVFPGILITAALFGALHLTQNAWLWQSGVLITVAGFGFGVIRHITGSTKASSLTHIAYNAVPCFVTLLQGAPTNHK